MHDHSSSRPNKVRRAAITAVCGIGLLATGTVPAVAAPAQSTFRAFSTTHQLTLAYSPQQIAAAYGFAPLYNRGVSGAGQKIALLETGDINAGDLQTFNTANGLPSAHITRHFIGKAFTIKYDPEATLDVEWAHALAPGATILLYFLNDQLSQKAGWVQFGAALRSAASHGAGSISISLGSLCKPGAGYQVTSAALAAVQAQGVSVFAASGDDGDLPGPASQCGNTAGVSYPASDPSVIAVGGTSVQLNQDNTIGSEIAWSLSGGGLAANVLRPVWQTAPTLPAGTNRWSPDVSFLGDPATGVRVYYHGKWHQVGGTSLGAPAWAAAWALIRADGQQSGKTVGAAETLIYRVANSSAYPSAFHDIVSGSNGRYSAGPGWDPVTGWGTPDVAQLDSAVQALSG